MASFGSKPDPRFYSSIPFAGRKENAHEISGIGICARLGIDTSGRLRENCESLHFKMYKYVLETVNN